jgi:exopolyphosphatase/guanosine-5'-triphosphate,3'-diphosphate pyrophosphatase
MTFDPRVEPRWEWRQFGSGFPAIDARLSAMGAEPRRSAEIYLVADREDVNVKIRGDQIDVKCRLRVDRGLERWAPILKIAFPLDRTSIGAVFALWNVPAPVLERSSYTLDAFLHDVIAESPDVRVVGVTKSRRLAPIDGCTVELARLEIDGDPLTTVAIESEDPDKVRELARVLDLAGLPNVSYVAALRRRLRVGADRARATALGGATS